MHLTVLSLRGTTVVFMTTTATAFGHQKPAAELTDTQATAQTRHETTLDPHRVRRVRKSYATRHVAAALDHTPVGHHLLSGPQVRPSAGDLVVARVVEIGSHTRLEGADSRRQLLFPGQEVLLAYGDRYAPDQFHAEVPPDLRTCHLVAAGGVAGMVLEKHSKMDDPTIIEPLGLLADTAGVVTLDRYAPHVARGGPSRGRDTAVIAVLGTSMNSGKSTTLACLVNGLTNAGLRVSCGKVTGTGAGNDTHLFRDAGARVALDFTDFGLPSTYKVGPERIRALWSSMLDALVVDGSDVVVVEIADGVFQPETARLLDDIAPDVDQVIFAAQDALGATAGVAALRCHGLDVAAVSGVLTASPLATAEAEASLAMPVVPTYDLCEPEVALQAVACVRDRRR